MMEQLQKQNLLLDSETGDLSMKNKAKTDDNLTILTDERNDFKKANKKKKNRRQKEKSDINADFLNYVNQVDLKKDLKREVNVKVDFSKEDDQSERNNDILVDKRLHFVGDSEQDLYKYDSQMEEEKCDENKYFSNLNDENGRESDSKKEHLVMKFIFHFVMLNVQHQMKCHYMYLWNIEIMCL